MTKNLDTHTKVYFVGAGPGDPELLTLKAANILRRARCCIYAGSLVSPAVLALLPSDCDRHNSAPMTLPEIIAVMREACHQGKDVVRLHTGEPSLYGAIREQMTELDRLAIDYEVIPGVSAFQAAAAALKVELTAPEISQAVVLTRACGRTPVPEEQELERFAATKATLCLFLSVDQIAKLALVLAKYYGADCPAMVVSHASWPNQQILKGTLADIAIKTSAAGILRTAIILVGWALGRGAEKSKLYDPAFAHSLRSEAN